MISMITKSRTHARDLHEILLDLTMVKNGLLIQTLFYLRPVGVFVRSVESFLITFDVKFIYFRGFCPVMFPASHVL